MQRLLQAASSADTGAEWEEGVEGELQLAAALLAAGATTVDALAAHALQVCLPEGVSAAAVREASVRGADSGRSFVAAWESLAARVRWASVSAAACVMSHIDQAASRVVDSASRAPDITGAATQHADASATLLYLCLAGAVLLQEHQNVYAGYVRQACKGCAADALPPHTLQILAALLEQEQQEADNEQGPVSDGPPVEPSTSERNGVDVAALLVPAAEAVCERSTAVVGGSAAGADAKRLLVALFGLALPAQLRVAEQERDVPSLHRVAAGAWQRTIAALPAPGGACAECVQELMEALVRQYRCRVQALAAAPAHEGARPLDDALRIARLASCGGAIASSVLALDARTGGPDMPPTAWSALISQLPGLKVAHAVLHHAASASEQTTALAVPVAAAAAASMGAHDGAAELDSEAALLLAALLHCQRAPDLAALPCALALEFALRPDSALGPALAVFSLHQADVLAIGEEEGTEHSWGTVLSVLVSMSADGHAVATSALLQLLAHLPSEQADKLAADLFLSWAPQHASPDAVATKPAKLHSARRIVAELTQCMQRGDAQLALPGREALAHEWLQYLRRKEPMLSQPAPRAGEEASDSACAHAALVSSLFAPGDAALPTDAEQTAFSDAYRLVDVLGPLNASTGAAEADDGSEEDGPQSRYITDSATAQAGASGVTAASSEQHGGANAALAAPWAAGLSESMAAEFAAAAQHQLRAANANVQACPLPRCAALLRLLAVCIGASTLQLSDVVWQRALRVLQAHLKRGHNGSGGVHGAHLRRGGAPGREHCRRAARYGCAVRVDVPLAARVKARRGSSCRTHRV